MARMQPTKKDRAPDPGECRRLRADVCARDDAEIRKPWPTLVRRQAAIIDRAAFELPLSKSLAWRNERETDWLWTRGIPRVERRQPRGVAQERRWPPRNKWERSILSKDGR